MPDGCWVSEGSSRLVVYRGGRTRTASSVVWEELHGPLPAGHIVHHVCGEGRCLNPEHLEAVSRREHLDRHGRRPGGYRRISELV